MNFGQFIRSKAIFKHLGILFGSTLVLLFIVFKSLDLYTDQGEFVIVPELHNLNSDSLVMASDEDYLQFIIIDSVFDANAKPGQIIRQHPLSGAKEKKGRKVYFTIVSKGSEYVQMPNLVDLSIRQAIDILKHSRLNVNQLIFVDNFARNAVLAQLIRHDTISPKTQILVGTAINLIIGDGHNPSGVDAPFLIGKTADEALDLILKSSLNFAGADTIFGSTKDNLRVFKQYPTYRSKLLLGDAVGFSLRSAKDFDMDSLINNKISDTLQLDTLNALELLNKDSEEF